ncbi:MAG TPA: prepilin-type N-terminal cleavage/methylation domain-containing protein, partial [Candidatus Hydrogenedentes bacterium]|nr:prepilin-type N-terminal cleavage/methylation domain-containing protein [Candidatus Hydrogenedentota bacterium]
MQQPITAGHAAAGPSPRRRRGFTLLEMLVALTVVSVGVAVFVGLFDMALTLSRNSRDRAACLDL